MTTYKGDVSAVVDRFYELTLEQLKSWGVHFHELKLGKPSFDVFIDDKNMLIQEFKKNIMPIKGFVAGSFDILHPGYIKLFKEASKNCDFLIVGLHSDPSIERGKRKPLLSKEDRREALEAIKYIDAIENYDTELDLINLINKIKPNVLFLGDDYRNKENNGTILGIKTYYIDRNHGWSTTKLKNEICLK